MSTDPDLRIVQLPAPKQVRDLFDGLVSGEVELAPAAPLAVTTRNPCTAATYVDDSLQIRAVVLADLPLSAYAGSALGLIPAPRAQEAVDEGLPTEEMLENLHEVLNIAAGLFDGDHGVRLRLHEVYPVGTELPPHVRLLSYTLGRREDSVLTLHGYGTGRFSVVLTPTA